MSRPQLQHNPTAAQTSHTVVNGGLIDFQDNLHRGTVECITPSMMVNIQQQQQHSMMMMQQQQQQAITPSSMAAGVFPNGGPSYISGPPTFLHVNGIMYRPVDTAGPQVDAQATPVPVVPETKVLSASEFHKEIDKRVQAKVQAYINEHRHPPDTESDQGEVAARRVRDLNASMHTNSIPSRAAAVPQTRASIQGRW
jgi:hypothetical protein